VLLLHVGGRGWKNMKKHMASSDGWWWWPPLIVGGRKKGENEKTYGWVVF
jgi:hypothetical protein